MLSIYNKDVSCNERWSRDGKINLSPLHLWQWRTAGLALGPEGLMVHLIVEGVGLGHWPPLPPRASHHSVAMVGGRVILIPHHRHSRGGTFISVSLVSFSVASGGCQDLGNLFRRPKSKRPE